MVEELALLLLGGVLDIPEPLVDDSHDELAHTLNSSPESLLVGGEEEVGDILLAAILEENPPRQEVGRFHGVVEHGL